MHPMNLLPNFDNCQYFANLISPSPCSSLQPPVNISPGYFPENWSVYNRPWPCYHCVLATRATNPSSLTRYTVKMSTHAHSPSQPMTEKGRSKFHTVFKSRDLLITCLQRSGDRGLLWLQKEHRCELFLFVPDTEFLSEFIQLSIYGLPHNIRDQIKMPEDKETPASLLKEIVVGLGNG